MTGMRELEVADGLSIFAAWLFEFKSYAHGTNRNKLVAVRYFHLYKTYMVLEPEDSRLLD